MGFEFSDDTTKPLEQTELPGAPVEDTYKTALAGPTRTERADVPVELATGLQLTDGDQVLASCSGGGCRPRIRGDRGAPAPETSDRTSAPGSFAEKVKGFINKLGDFLNSVLPPEFAAPARQFLGQIGKFLTENLRGVDVSDRRPDGGRPIEINLEKPFTIPKVAGGQDLEVGPKLSFDMKVGPKGPELQNIKGVKVKVAGGLVDADVTGARLVRGEDGKLAIEAKVKAAGIETPVKIPLNKTSLIPGLRRR